MCQFDDSAVRRSLSGFIAMYMPIAGQGRVTSIIWTQHMTILAHQPSK